jgi:hypothetical protein
VKHVSVTWQQLGGNRFSQQCMARPVLTTGAGFGQQPRGGQLAQSAADNIDV